jgi:NAD-dependent protein deacetylase/lipoamidase
VFLVIGTSALVYPAAGLAAVAKRAGANVIEINVAETPLSHRIATFLQGSSAELLPQLMA